MARAQEASFGRPPLFRRGGGEIATVFHLKTIGVEWVKVGWALPGDNMHAPNERLHLPTFHRGIETVIRYLFELRSSHAAVLGEGLLAPRLFDERPSTISFQPRIASRNHADLTGACRRWGSASLEGS